MMDQIKRIKPGILVDLSTHVRGNVRNTRRVLEYAHVDEYGRQISRAENTKIVLDPAEQKRAEQTVNKAAYLIRKLCNGSDHGLLCPNERRNELNEAIAEAREMCRDFNRDAYYTRIRLDIFCGEIVADDVNTARALFAETEEFMNTILEGLEQADTKKVREAMRKTRGIGQMLAPDANKAVVAALAAADEACKRITRAGEEIVVEIDAALLDTISAARSTFLNFDDESLDFDVELPRRELNLEAS